MNNDLKEQIKRLKKMGIDLDIPDNTPDNELSNLLAQIDDQLAELTSVSDLALDSEEPATLANMSALAIDIDVEVQEVIAALANAYEDDTSIFAAQGLAILFTELEQRSLAFSVDDTASDIMQLGNILNACLAKHGLKPVEQSTLEQINNRIDHARDNIFEIVDDIWFELCHLLDQRGLSLIQLISSTDAEQTRAGESLKLIAIAEPVGRKWTNRGFGQYILLSFSELFLAE